MEGKCRFCGMTKVDFKINNRPNCEWQPVRVINPTQPRK